MGSLLANYVHSKELISWALEGTRGLGLLQDLDRRLAAMVVLRCPIFFYGKLAQIVVQFTPQLP